MMTKADEADRTLWRNVAASLMFAAVFALAATMPLPARAQPAKPEAKSEAKSEAKAKSSKPATPKAAASKKGKPAKPANDEDDAPRARAAAPGQPSLVGQYGSWGAYVAASGGRKICYALAKPSTSKTSRAGASRDPAYILIATRPSERVRDEVSVQIGYPFKSGSEASIDIGGTRFALYTQGDGAWIKNAAEETRMVEALRKAGEATVRGTSTRGTETTDVFALKGLGQALDRVAQECKP